MRTKILLVSAFFAITPIASFAQVAPPPTQVDLELALLVDVSGSVNATEYALQMNGYKTAFNSAAVQAKIAGGIFGKIAVTLLQWSSSGQQAQSIGWTEVTSGNAGAFGDTIGGLGRAYSGSTAPGSAINFIAPTFASNLFTADRWVIDVSGDGAQNDGASTSGARDTFLASAPGGVETTVNGIAILGESGLLAWYNANIKGGTNAFVYSASGFDTFAGAITDKLVAEIGGGAVPEPSTYGMIGAALLLGLIVSRRIRR